MNGSPPALLPQLRVADFGRGKDHVAEPYQNGRIFAILHVSDVARQVLPNLYLDPSDDHLYLFIHGGQEATRFENLVVGTHEIPEFVVARLLANQYGNQLNGMPIRVCACYGNLLRPGDSRTAVGALAGLLPLAVWEGYHGLVYVDPTTPPQLRLGAAVAWDPVTGPYVIGPPGLWESVTP
jgi:hypothetical protein